MNIPGLWADQLALMNTQVTTLIRDQLVSTTVSHSTVTLDQADRAQILARATHIAGVCI